MHWCAFHPGGSSTLPSDVQPGPRPGGQDQDKAFIVGLTYALSSAEMEAGRIRRAHGFAEKATWKYD